MARARIRTRAIVATDVIKLIVLGFRKMLRTQTGCNAASVTRLAGCQPAESAKLADIHSVSHAHFTRRIRKQFCRCVYPAQRVRLQLLRPARDKLCRLSSSTARV